ncbi:MAG: hypothetical protein ACKV2O_22455 [Acidimicrobiales bacterium]
MRVLERRSMLTQPKAVTPRSHCQPLNVAEPSTLYRFFVAVVVVQGVHLIEHIIQLLQVEVFDVPEDDAFGLLGYVVNFNDTEEWLHLGFNLAFVLSLCVVALGMHHLTPAGSRSLPRAAWYSFVIGGVGLESWHITEHVVIITNVIRNSGCPCPGIGDRALNVSDTRLHLGYNLIAYAATVIGFVAVRCVRRAQLNPRP